MQHKRSAHDRVLQEFVVTESYTDVKIRGAHTFEQMGMLSCGQLDILYPRDALIITRHQPETVSVTHSDEDSRIPSSNSR